MNISNLSANQKLLTDYMEVRGYSFSYIREVKKAIHFIICHEDNSWENYDAVFIDYCRTFPNCKRAHRSAINMIAKFDNQQIYPDGGRIQFICKQDAYSLLNEEYRLLIDGYKGYCNSLKLAASTIDAKEKINSSFLYQIQKRGCATMAAISEDDVLSVFCTKNGRVEKSHEYKNEIRRMMKYGMEQGIVKCYDIMNYLPAIRHHRKNIPYLKEEEVTAIKVILDSPESNLSMRDKAVGRLLLYTGLRASDIAGLLLTSIDWRRDIIRVEQKKTGRCLNLPLRPIIGNAIYDYLVKERPFVGDPHVFISTLKPYRPLKPCSLKNIVKRIFFTAGIRQGNGDRGSTHLFRHSFTASLLEVGTKHPVITQILGHASPKSIEPYLNTDFKHLKECAIGITDFPIPEEVFTI